MMRHFRSFPLFCHSRESGNPKQHGIGAEIPAYAGITKRGVLGLVFLLAACGGNPAPEKYTLQAALGETTAVCRSGASIKINEPSSGPGLDSAHIAVIDRPGHLTFYRGVAWSAQASAVVQAYLADAFEGSGHFATVSTDADTVPADWRVESQLKDFEIDQTGGTPMVKIRLSATLVRASDRKAVLSLPLESQTDATGQSIDGIVQLFNGQLGDLSQQMLQQFARKIGCNVKEAP